MQQVDLFGCASEQSLLSFRVGEAEYSCSSFFSTPLPCPLHPTRVPFCLFISSRLCSRCLAGTAASNASSANTTITSSTFPSRGDSSCHRRRRRHHSNSGPRELPPQPFRTSPKVLLLGLSSETMPLLLPLAALGALVLPLPLVLSPTVVAARLPQGRVVPTPRAEPLPG